MKTSWKVKQKRIAAGLMIALIAMTTISYCKTAHCGRCKPHFDFGDNTFPIVPYRHLPQTLIGMTADCRSLV